MKIENITKDNLVDYGKFPFIFNIEKFTDINPNFRTALWTGDNFQVTLMTIMPGEDIGLEKHDTVDQFIRIESGIGLTKMGDKKDSLPIKSYVDEDYAIIIPAGTWHNIINIGDTPLKLYSIYAPREHPYATVHPTKQDAIDAEYK